MLNLPWELWLNADLPPGFAFEAEYEATEALLEIKLRNSSDLAVRPRDIVFSAEIDAPTAGGWIWLHGRYMQTDAIVRPFGETMAEGYDGRYVRTGDEGSTYISREVVAITLLSKPSPVLVLGCTAPGRVFVDFELDVSEDDSQADDLRIIYDLDGIEIGPGAEYALPPVFIREGHDALDLIEEYGRVTASTMNARVPDHVPTGWCSWYYFYNRVSEADVVANLETMIREGHPAEYVQIDDGFQSFTGDWLTPNAKFPSGMKALADRIREAGYKPGLWLAPFVLHEDSAAFREHPDMALKTREGETVFVQTWLGRCAVLDCTNPEAEAWLRNVVATVVREWGYVYLKLDACSYAAQPASQVQYHAAGTTAPANLRRGLEIIRDEAGGETFILGCTCHFGPAIGLVDAMRVGPDVKELWANGPNPSVKHAMRLTLQRNWMHNTWWANDPDCLIVRDTDTELNEAETRFLATGIALSGGMVVASDDLPRLPEDRRDLAYALFPPAGVAARPLFPSQGPVPSAWRAELGEGRSLVGVLNWSDQAVWVPWSELLEPGEVAFDIWNRRPLPMGDVALRPHEGTLWQVAKAGATPRLVGDSGHLTFQGLFQRPVSGRLQVRNDSTRSRTVAIQHRGQIYTEELAPGEMRWFD
jgi:alpha-galactosidase